MNKAFFITGTGTNIGKTIVTCTLIKQLAASGKAVMAIKPVISGWDDASGRNDTIKLLSALGLDHTAENISKVSPWRFKAPLAPSMAARFEGTQIDYTTLVSFCKNSASSSKYLLCEGAGGVMVPLTDSKTMLDLMREVNFSAILVTGTYLGAISHTLTAINALENAGVSIVAIIVNEAISGVPPLETARELGNFTKHPIRLLPKIITGDEFSWQSGIIL